VIKKLAIVLTIISVIFLIIAVITNVSTDISAEDEGIFNNFFFRKTMQHLSFADEIALIRLVQKKILTAAPLHLEIPEFEEREPKDLVRLRHGMCFDRSRAIDKGLKFMGFYTRHVYMLYGQGKLFLPALFTYRQPSHAVTEVKTSRGWILVDSNSDWISLAKNGTPIPADQIWQRAGEFSTIPGYFNIHFWAIPGMYSRSGFLYPPYLPFPDINWRDFLASFVD